MATTANNPGPELVHDIPVKNPIDITVNNRPPAKSHLLAKINKPVFTPVKDEDDDPNTIKPNPATSAKKVPQPLPRVNSSSPLPIIVVIACSVALVLIIAAVMVFRKG